MTFWLQEEVDREVGEDVYHLGLLSGKDEEILSEVTYWLMFPHKLVQVHNRHLLIPFSVV